MRAANRQIEMLRTLRENHSEQLQFKIHRAWRDLRTNRNGSVRFRPCRLPSEPSALYDCGDGLAVIGSIRERAHKNKIVRARSRDSYHVAREVFTVSSSTYAGMNFNCHQIIKISKIVIKWNFRQLLLGFIKTQFDNHSFCSILQALHNYLMSFPKFRIFAWFAFF